MSPHKCDKPSFQIAMKLDESAASQGSKHADEVIPTLELIVFSSNPSFQRRLPDTQLSNPQNGRERRED